MTAYAVDSWSSYGEYDTVLADMATKIETITNTKTFRLMTIAPRGSEFVGILIYDT